MLSISVLCWNIGMFYVLQIFFAMNLVEKVVICCTLPQTLRRTQVLSLYCLVKRKKTNLEPLCLQTWYRPISFTTVKNTVWNFDLPRSYFHFSPKVRTSSWGATLVETLDELRTYRENSTIYCGMWLGKHNVTIYYRLLNTLWFSIFYKNYYFLFGESFVTSEPRPRYLIPNMRILVSDELQLISHFSRLLFDNVEFGGNWLIAD